MAEDGESQNEVQDGEPINVETSVVKDPEQEAHEKRTADAKNFVDQLLSSGPALMATGAVLLIVGFFVHKANKKG